MPTTRNETPRERLSRGSVPSLVVAIGLTLILAIPAAANLTIQGSSARLDTSGTDFGALPPHSTTVNAPDPTNFTNTAETKFDGAGSAKIDAVATQATHANASGDSLTLNSTQSFLLRNTGSDQDRQNMQSGANSGLSIAFCTTKRSSFLFSASGQMNVPPDRCTTAPNCARIKQPFADAFVLATFTCLGCPNVAIQQFVVGVIGGPVNGVSAKPSGSKAATGTISPGCYSLESQMNAGLVSPLLCHNKVGDCDPFKFPPDINNNPPQAQGSFTMSLTVTPATSTDDDEITWVGPANGAFGDANNWNPKQVPTITPDKSDTAVFGGGGTLTVDVSAGGAAASLFAPRAAGTRTVGRLHVKGRNLVVTDFQSLDLDDGSLDKASLRIGNGGTLRFSSGHLVAHNARVGLNGGGTLVVADPDTFFTADLLLVGEDGNGLLDVKGGAAADAGEVRLGNGGGIGSATIEGRNTTWTTGRLAVGHQGRALLTIKDTGVVTSTDAFVDEGVPPAQVPADGTLLTRCSGRSGGANVEVTDRDTTSSAWHVKTLSVGGLGCVEVALQGGIATGENGGGDVRIGTSQAGEGVVFVDTGGVLIVGGNLTVGDSGHGRLELEENHVLDSRITVTGALRIGDALPPAGFGTVIVNGDPATSGASLTSNSLRIPDGNEGFGRLFIKAGATIATTTSAEIGSEITVGTGSGVVDVDGGPNSGPAAAGLTRWNIGQSLTVGGTQVGSTTGFLNITNGVVAVGSGPTHGTVTINAGGHVTAFDQNASLLTNGGTFHNNGRISGAITLEGSYAADSQGHLVVGFGGVPIIVHPAPPGPNIRAGAAADGAGLISGPSEAAAAQLALPPAGPIVITGDADLTNTTLVLQFVNGFAPHQGDQFSVVDVQGQLTGDFADVQLVGVADGASFAVDPQSGVATSLTDAVALPLVTMKAPKKLKESAKKGGKIKLTRTGPTTDPLTVDFRFGGTAEAGIDYSAAGSITFPAKKKATTLVVVPFPDGLFEAPETIEVTVLPGDGYQTTSTPTATITLLSTEKNPKK